MHHWSLVFQNPPVIPFEDRCFQPRKRSSKEAFFWGSKHLLPHKVFGRLGLVYRYRKNFKPFVRIGTPVRTNMTWWKILSFQSENASSNGGFSNCHVSFEGGKLSIIWVLSVQSSLHNLGLYYRNPSYCWCLKSCTGWCGSFFLIIYWIIFTSQVVSRISSINSM